MDEFKKSGKEKIAAAHQAEMDEMANGKQTKIKIVTEDQVDQILNKYASLCAEYSACKGIYSSYHQSGMSDEANTFAAATTIARESAKAVEEIIEILGIRHIKI